MNTIIVCEGFSNGEDCPWKGQFLEWYNPEVSKGEEMGGWTDDKNKAMRFINHEDAMSLWRIRRMYDGGFLENGEADRPLTNFNVTITSMQGEDT